MVLRPDIRYGDRSQRSYDPSWSANPGYINQTHRDIFEITNSIPGWQAHGDSYKLFEMGYFAGDIILEIGMYSGRSAVVELLGALSRDQTTPPPQYFGVDVDPNAILRTNAVLKRLHLERYAFLFHGNIQQFAAEVDVTPTMVFVDGDHSYHGCKTDLSVLSRMLPEGVPVLCHDFCNPENQTGEYGVDRACEEWEKDGYAQFAGIFGCSALYVTTSKCARSKGGLTVERFSSLKKQLDDHYRATLGVDAFETALRAGR